MSRLLKFLLVILAFTAKAAVADVGVEVRIGVPNIPPFGYDEDKGEQVDWWRELAKRAGFQPNIRLFPLIRLRKALERGVIDAAIYGPGPESQESVVDLLVHQPVHFSFFNPAQPDGDTKKLRGLVVGVVRGASSVEELSRKFGFEAFPVSSYAIGLGMLNRGRIDALYGIENIINFNFRKNRDGLAGFTLPTPVQVKTIFNKVRASQAFAEKHPDIVAKIKSTGEAMKREGFVEKTIRLHEN